MSLAQRPLIAGVLHGFGKAKTLHAWKLAETSRCEKCVGCFLARYGHRKNSECTNPGRRDVVVAMCGSGPGSQLLSAFLDDLHEFGAQPTSAVDCRFCARALAKVTTNVEGQQHG